MDGILNRPIYFYQKDFIGEGPMFRKSGQPFQMISIVSPFVTTT